MYMQAAPTTILQPSCKCPATVLQANGCCLSCKLASVLNSRCVLHVLVLHSCRTPIPHPLPENLGPNEFGYISIFTLITSLVASTMLNEAFWQRVWASSDRRSLHGGALLGYCAIVLLIFLSGFGGWLAFAGGYVTDSTNPNVYLMQVGWQTGGWGALPGWAGAHRSVLCCAVLCIAQHMHYAADLHQPHLLACCD